METSPSSSSATTEEERSIRRLANQEGRDRTKMPTTPKQKQPLLLRKMPFVLGFLMFLLTPSSIKHVVAGAQFPTNSPGRSTTPTLIVPTAGAPTPTSRPSRCKLLAASMLDQTCDSFHKACNQITEDLESPKMSICVVPDPLIHVASRRRTTTNHKHQHHDDGADYSKEQEEEESASNNQRIVEGDTGPFQFLTSIRLCAAGIPLGVAPVSCFFHAEVEANVSVHGEFQSETKLCCLIVDDDIALLPALAPSPSKEDAPTTGRSSGDPSSLPTIVIKPDNSKESSATSIPGAALAVWFLLTCSALILRMPSFL